MPFPSLTFPEQLDPLVRHELEQFVSLVQGYLSVEHRDTGAHSNVTAWSLRTVKGTDPSSTGDLTVGGNATIAGTLASNGAITADADGTPVVIGPDGTFGPGIELTNSTVSKWRISASQSGGNPVLLIRDELQTGDTGAVDLVRTTSGASPVYELIPHASSISLNIGTNSSGQRVNEVNALLLRSFGGVYERARTAAMGEWTDVALSSGNFTASGGGTWTGVTKTTIAYRIIGKSMLFAVEVDGGSITGAPATLSVKIPGSFTAAKNMRTLCQIVDAGTAAVGVARVVATGTTVDLQASVAGAGWTNTGGGNTSVRFLFEFEVQ